MLNQNEIWRTEKIGKKSKKKTMANQKKTTTENQQKKQSKLKLKKTEKTGGPNLLTSPDP